MTKRMPQNDKIDSVAIIILNWNGWEDTIECLESLSNLDYWNYKIFLVDNASQNDSVKRIKEVFPDLEILCSKENLGFSGGNNLAIKKAIVEEYEYFWLLNNDTTVNNQSLVEMIKKFKSDKDFGIIGSVIIDYYNPTLIQSWGGGDIFVPLALTRSYHNPVEDERIHIMHGATMLISRKVIQDIGMLDEDYFFYMEDTDFSIRVSRKYKLGVAKKSYVYHKGGSSLRSNSGHKNIIADIHFIKSNGRFMRKYNIPIPFIILRLLLIIANRIKKREFDRILPAIRAFIEGYNYKISEKV